MSEPGLGKAVLELSTDDTKLVAGLNDAKTEAKLAATAIADMGKALSGVGLERDAKTIVAAIGAIQGATKLTDAEAKKYLTTLDSWIQKSERMGKEVAPDILKTRDAVKQVDDAAKRAASGASSMKDALSSMAGTLGLAFSVGSVLAFGKSVFDTASQIHDTSEKLGISAEAMQGFKFAAEQAGSSLEAVGTALNKMNANLAEGGTSTVKALKDVGLDFQTIRNMKPEDAFLAIADAVQRTRDPMVQSDVALKLFGKSAAELLPAIKEGFREAADGASKMSTDTVNSLEAAQDAWGKLANSVTIASGIVITHALHAASAITDSGHGFALWAENAIKYGVGAATALADAEDTATQAAKKNHDVILKGPPIHHKTAEELAAEEEARKKAAAAAEHYAEIVAKIFAATIPLTLAQKEQVITLGKLGVSTSLMADYLQASEAAIGKFNESLKEQAKSIAEIGKNLTKIPHNVTLLLETKTLTSGVPLIDVAAVQKASSTVKEISDATFNDIEGRMKAHGVFTQDVLARMARDAREQYDSMRASGKFTAAELQAAWEKWYAADQAARGHWAAGFQSDLEKIVGAFTQLSQVAGESMGAVAKGLGTVLASVNTAITGVETFKKGLSAMKSGDAMSGIASMASGITGVVAAAMAAVQAIKAIFSALDRNKGRDLVVDFADTFGGFDALHAKLLELGDAGEALWVKLTQGVGRNDPKAAQAAIDEVTKALADQAANQEAATVTTEEGAQATIETAAQAALALDELNDRLQTNAAHWGEWSDEVTGDLQRLADQIRGLGLPVPGGGIGGSVTPPARGFTLPPIQFPDGGSSGLSASARAGFSVAGRATVIENRIILDGRELARNQVRHLPNELARVGVGR